jgi:hypothetical protein
MATKGGKQAFNPKPYKGPRTATTLRLRPDMHTKGREAAERLGLSFTEYLENLIREAPMPAERPLVSHEQDGLLSA